MKKIIGITGFARSGKDTLFNLLNKQFPNKFTRFAFADQLKYDLYDFIRDKFGFDVFKLTDEQKLIIRPILVAYGCSKRQVDPLHWVKELNQCIFEYEDGDIGIPVITDVRFANEAEYFKNNCDFTLIKVSRLINGVYMSPPNDEEAYNQPLVDKYVDFQIDWETEPDLTKLSSYAYNLHNEIFNGK